MQIKDLGNGAKFIRKDDEFKHLFIKINYGAINAVSILDGKVYNLNPNENVIPIVM